MCTLNLYSKEIISETQFWHCLWLLYIKIIQCMFHIIYSSRDYQIRSYLRVPGHICRSHSGGAKRQIWRETLFLNPKPKNVNSTLFEEDFFLKKWEIKIWHRNKWLVIAISKGCTASPFSLSKLLWVLCKQLQRCLS